MFRISFLTILKIYKDYFKGRQRLRKCEVKLYSCKLWPKTEFALVHFSLEEATMFVHLTKEFCDLHRVDELKNFAANIFLKLVSKPRTRICASNWLVTYWEPCIKRRNCNYRTSPIGYWGKNSTVGWYKVLWFLYL